MPKKRTWRSGASNDDGERDLREAIAEAEMLRAEAESRAWPKHRPSVQRPRHAAPRSANGSVTKARVWRGSIASLAAARASREALQASLEEADGLEGLRRAAGNRGRDSGERGNRGAGR